MSTIDPPAAVTTVTAVAAPETLAETLTTIAVAPVADTVPDTIPPIPVAPAVTAPATEAGLTVLAEAELTAPVTDVGLTVLADAGSTVLAEVGPTAPATEAGLTVLAEARWPESDLDLAPPALPGFIVSSFSPVAAEAAARCLRRGPAAAAGGVTAVLIASARGDLASAVHVAAAVDSRGPIGPLLFFQSVPNAVAGHIAARWNLTGPVVCVADRASALEAAALLIADGDADRALVLHVEDTAHAVLLEAPTPGGRA